MPDIFKNKNILIASPQNWGKMRISKHHYAIELAKRGNNVYFLNPPTDDLPNSFSIVRHDSIDNLYILDYRPFFNYIIRFHFRRVYDVLMNFQIKILLKKLNKKIDILWNFETNLYSNLRAFHADRIIYHVVDQVTESHSIKPALNADVVISVANEILDKYGKIPIPKLLINHGLGEAFIEIASVRLQKDDLGHELSGKPKIGYVGNLFVGHLDKKTIREVIEKNKQADFHFWGSYEAKSCNIAGDFSSESHDFIRFLQGMPNVSLHGSKEPEALALDIQEMDAFLICYDLSKDPNNGCNTHKLLEYLSTGKVIISNKVSSYLNFKSLIQMLDEDNNGKFKEMFSHTINNLAHFNRPELQAERIKYALSNSYSAHIEEIEEYLSDAKNK